MKKLLLFLLFSIALIGVVSAIPTYKQGQTIQLTTICDNCTQVNLTSVIYPNGSLALLGQFSMTKNGTNYNKTFSDISTLGTYSYVTCGDLNGVLTCEDTTDRTFEITYSGIKLSEGQSTLYAILIGLFILIFAGITFGITKLPSSNEKDEDGKIMSIKRLKYLRAPLYFVLWMLFIAILFLSSNLAFSYLGEQMFAKILFNLYRIAFGITPLIVVVWLVAFFIMFFQDRQFQRMINRGFFPQEKRR